MCSVHSKCGGGGCSTGQCCYGEENVPPEISTMETGALKEGNDQVLYRIPEPGSGTG